MSGQPWQAQALCRDEDPELFFAGGYHSVVARRICARCPVVDQCLSTAIAQHEHFGIWGGLGPQQRTAMVARRSQRSSGARRDQTEAAAEMASAQTLQERRLSRVHRKMRFSA
ncbi:WhiB family transcriptional regulator [Kocuria palustris]|uniref:WhiB family transcriptional regulator n=1 Tax=Kocuria palustris TaxID=71999 RepID=UPI0021A51D80|nr:WhiB family transcriptional regulator [Kocuria palustris]MCT1835144.1 WhiB family transcriptional regulator [Kocuria palustris]MDH5151964.1 WhiB family transcriptional regulator [Kocuria palustris]